ncbi:MAG TPA: hypothetical protein VE010_17915 [Thermoanaerobaculia bacterium]|nr:hypothetical protein [Thermoanaerobaculia bacterium]
MSDDRQPFQRFDFLSTSESGLNYVRERKGGVTRVLTESELADFADDPKPCAECAEQFGCEHFNCAGEALMTEQELESIPPQWLPFAKEYGISRNDLERLQHVELHEGEWRLVHGGAGSDMRMQELVILLNEFR